VNRLRTAVIGVGHLGRIHARILSKLEGFALVGVVDPAEENRLAAAAECGAPGFASHRELPETIEAAVVAAPTRYHHALALDLLSRGVHLLVEKPLAATTEEADELVDAARRGGAMLQVGHIERFNPAFSAAVGHLQRPKYIEALRCGPFSFRSTDIGVVLDLMIHDIDLVLAVVHAPLARVEALGTALFTRHEDVAQARLVFDDGCVANLSASRASRAPARTMHVWCERGLASLDFAARTATMVHPSEAILSRTLDVERVSMAERGLLKERLYDDHLPIVQLTTEPCDAITAELSDFRDSIVLGRTPRVPGEAGRDAVAVAEQVIEAIAAHSWDHADERLRGQGRRGPLALPTPRIIRGPHWGRKPAIEPSEQREAG
jgi:predicted dehydrogenase